MIDAEFTCASFYRFLEEKKLVGVRCKKCQAIYLPPRPTCLNCRSTEMEWVPVRGEGKLVSFTTIAMGTASMVAAGYDRNRQYCCGVVELDEGPMAIARILGLNDQEPDSIQIGTPMYVEFPDGKVKPPVLTFRARVVDK